MATDDRTPTQEGSPDEASGYADGSAPFTLATRPGDGRQFSQVTVPRGITGEVSLREVTESGEAPSVDGVTWIGQRLDLVAPSAPVDDPLVVEIYVQRIARKRRVDGRNAVLFHSDRAEDRPVALPRCERGTKGSAVPDRCLSSARSVRRDGIDYIRLRAYATDNGSWRPGYV